MLLRERWHDSGLKARIKAELGQRMIPAYGASPRAVCNRQLTSADNGFTFFTYCARYIGAEPLIQECPGDMFVAIIEEKKGLGRLRLILEKGARATVDIMNFPANEKREIGQCELLTGANLVDFHHALLKLDGHDLEIYDNSAWYRNLDRASNFYYPMLLHFVAHAVLFENYPDDDESREACYTRKVVLPAIERIKATVGLTPLIVRAFPENQTDEEHIYWWSHSPKVNRYLLDYALEHGLKIKPCRIGGPMTADEICEKSALAGRHLWTFRLSAIETGFWRQSSTRQT